MAVQTLLTHANPGPPSDVCMHAPPPGTGVAVTVAVPVAVGVSVGVWVGPPHCGLSPQRVLFSQNANSPQTEQSTAG